jgi:alkyl sulfatase BDS1-like metallo-beta-lactamase superfamily hydrolase
VLNWQFTDTQQNFVLNLDNSALSHVADATAKDADATLTLSRQTLDEIALQKITFPAALQTGKIVVTGKSEKLLELLSMIDSFATMFPLVEPRPTR